MRGACSMTPVVTNAGAGNNSAAVDVLHNEIKATLGGKLNVEATATYFDTVAVDESSADGPKWYYCPDLIVTVSAANWYDFLSNSSGVWNDGNPAAVADKFTGTNTDSIHDTDDTVRMMYIENTGLDDTGAATTNLLWFSQTSLGAAQGSFMLEPGESMIVKFSHRLANTTIATTEPGHLHLDCTNDTGTTPAAPGHVLAKVVAFMEDNYKKT